MQIIDEGFFIKLLPNEGMILTDKATETMRAEEIYLGKTDSADNYKDIPIDTPIPEPQPETDIPVKAELIDPEEGVVNNDE